MRSQVEILAERGEPDIYPLVEIGQAKIRWPVIQTTAQLGVHAAHGGNLSGYEVNDALAFQCWLHRDKIIERLEQQIDDASDDANALTIEQRKVAENEILDELLTTERAEQLVLAQSEGAGLDIQRPDADCRAVLGIAILA
jgi:hypothetical protein